MIDVPRVVRNKAIAIGAERWIEDLPDLVAEIEREWSIVVGRVFGDATEALVTEATMEDGTPAVLKLVMPRDRDAAEAEMTVLRLADGDGCVRLLREDGARGAMLLERLGRSLHELGLPLQERLVILCDTASRVWRPAPGCGLRTGAEKGRWLIDTITTMWEELDRPCAERTVQHALDCAAHRIAAHDDERSVLVHGDVHEWNAIEADTGFKLVDPDGLLCEPEYDLGVLMREDPLDLLPGQEHDRSAWLAARTGLDETAIWEWGVIERVSTALLCIKVDLQPVGNEMLAVAERIAAG